MVGSVVETTTTYEPFGKLLAQTGSSGTVYGFTGEQEDAAAGLVYLRARYYNPALKLFMSRDPFPGMPTMPATQHGYSYVHNNAPNYTDPSGNCIGFLGGLDTAICLGAGTGFIFSWAGQVENNMDNGMSFFDAVYYKNINWNHVGAATVAGGVAGGTGFIVGGAASGFVGGLLPQATTLTGAISNGFINGAAGGIVGGAAAGGTWQLLYNVLTPCTAWSDNVLQATGTGAVTGGVLGGVLGGVSGGLRFWQNNPTIFQNNFPDDLLDRPQTIPLDHLKGINQRRLIYVVLDDGTLVVGKPSDWPGGGHIDLAGGQPVRAAGEFGVVNGELRFIDNASGHYLPKGYNAQRVAEGAFQRLGFETIGRYTEKVWQGGYWVPVNGGR